MRYPLVDGQVISARLTATAAAMRYTESRGSHHCDDVDDIENRQWIWWTTMTAGKEPAVLPAAIPNLLVNALRNCRGHGHQLSSPQPY